MTDTATQQLSGLVLQRPLTVRWISVSAFTMLLALLFFFVIGYVIAVGVGVWGINTPVAWGFAITSYVWWIGIGMAGTFISSALLLAHQPWRSAINRIAETTTVFAVMIAGIFPILHLGRPWLFYWLAPYPNDMGLWPQFRSALVWDFFAITAYLIVSVLFWYLSLIPDLATLRDRASGQYKRVFYALLALGWRGEARQWRIHQSATRLMAGIAVTLVFSVHSMVALDFSQGIVPAWHTDLYPPYFVAGALFSGFAAVMVITIPMRHLFKLQNIIKDTHLDKLARITLAASLVMAYCYATEIAMAYYSQDHYAIEHVKHKTTGVYAWAFWSTIVLNVLIPQLLWFKRVRTRALVLFFISLGIVVGMWIERFVIVVVGLYKQYLPSTWGMFYPTLWDWALLAFSIGAFAFLILLYLRLFPAGAMFELRQQVFEREHKP